MPNVVQTRAGWKLNIIAGATIQVFSFNPSLVSTTLGTYPSRIMIDSLMMAF
jgi:hypothetical protein